MAGNIKGITIEIGGQTTKLQKALAQARTATAPLKKELGQINKLLKVNPSSMTALGQKQKVLAGQIEQTKNKLSSLKQAQDRAMKDPNVSKNTEEYRKLEREIEFAANELKKLQTQQHLVAVQSSRLGQVSAKYKAISQRANEAAQKVRGISIASGLLAGASLKVSADFEKEMSKVREISKATGEDFEKLKAKAREMGAKTEFSATQSAEAMKYMGMAGWKAGEMIDGLEGVMDLASASAEDLGNVSDIVTDGLTAFGLKAKDSSRFADVLASTATNANTNVAMMGETFAMAAPVAGALGYKLEDVALATGLMANSGIKASVAGTALRSWMSRMAKPTAEVRTAMKKLGISMTDSKGHMKTFREVMADTRKGFSKLDEKSKAMYASMIAGKQGMAGMLSVINSSDEDFNKLASAIDNSTGSAKEMAEQMRDNLYGDMTQLKSAAEELGIGIGEGLRPVMRAAAKTFKGFVDVLNKMPQGMKAVVALGLAGTASLYPLTKIVAGTTGAFSSLAMGLASMRANALAGKGAIGKLWGVLSAHPALAVAGAIAGAGVALYAFWQSVNKIRNEMKKFHEEQEKKLGAYRTEAGEIDFLKQRLEELAAIEDKTGYQKMEMSEIVKQLNQKVKGLNLTYDEENDKLNQSIGTIKKKIDAYKEEARVKAYAEQHAAYLKKQIEYQEKMRKKLDEVRKAEKELEAIRANAGTSLNNDAAIQKQQGVVNTLKKDLSDLTKNFNEAKESADNMGNTTVFLSLVQKARQAGIDVPNALQEAIVSNKLAVPQSIEELKRLCDPEFAQMVEEAQRKGIDIPEKIKNGLASGKMSVAEASSELRRLTTENLDGASQARMQGRFTAEGYASGIESSGWRAVGAAANLVDKVMRQIKRSQDSHSPSKKTFKLGRFAGQGYGLGIESEIKNTQRSAKRLVNQGLKPLGISGQMGKLNAVMGYNLNANNTTNVNLNYQAIEEAMTRAITKLDMGISIDGRKFGRAIAESGVVIN